MKRFYEWRDQSGKRIGDPKLAENACSFRAESRRSGNTVKLESPGSGLVVSIFVVSTGEKVGTEANDAGSAVRLDESFPWFNADGLQVKA